jgi:hypothetical protein
MVGWLVVSCWATLLTTLSVSRLDEQYPDPAPGHGCVANRQKVKKWPHAEMYQSFISHPLGHSA